MERLSSDMLEAQFGPTELQIISQADAERIIATRVAATGQLLELSRVTFRPEATRFGAVHADIVSGASMGKAFRKHGVRFRRDVHGTYAADAPPALHERFAAYGRATIVMLTVLAGEAATPYADIFEVYTPAAAWPTARQQPDTDTLEQLAAFASELAAKS